MHVISVDNVNEALPLGLAYLRDCGRPEQTRNGPALVAPGPVATVYRDPRRRVLFDPTRDANPFFHLIEAVWILAGRNDVKPLAWFNKRMAEYSDDGKTFHAPYGYRLRKHFGFDQIEAAIDLLKKSPQSRQVVLQIWDPKLDLAVLSKDLPCNDMVMLRVRDDAQSMHSSGKVLDITVCNRSNDVIWGAYGANAVQFSILQEYIACSVGVGVGEYTQVSHNYHAYTETPYYQTWAASAAGKGYHAPNPYAEDPTLETTPLLVPGESITHFDNDLWAFSDAMDKAGSEAEFLELVGKAAPTIEFFRTAETMVWMHLRRPEWDNKSECDWVRAGEEWIERRRRKPAESGMNSGDLIQAMVRDGNGA